MINIIVLMFIFVKIMKKISIKENLNISKTVACEFPTIFMIDDNLYIQWLEFNELLQAIQKIMERLGLLQNFLIILKMKLL